MSSADRKSTLASAWQGLLRRFSAWVEPHPSVTEGGRRIQARLLAGLALVLLFTNLLGVVSTMATSTRNLLSFSNLLLAGLAFFTLIVYLLARSRYVRAGAILSVVVLSALAYLTLIFGYRPDMNVADVLYIYLLMAFVFALAMLDTRGLLITVIINTGLIFMLPAINPALPGNDIATEAGTISTIGFLLVLTAAVRNAVERDRLRQLQEANRELDGMRLSLEQRVAERTCALQTSAEVSRRLSTILNTDDLLSAVVQDVRSAFGYYHTQVYLWDRGRENLLLTGATGEAGALMLGKGHQVMRGRGLVGRAAETNRPVLAADTAADQGWLPNPLLPETRAEAAVPIAIGEQVLGVLDVQHDRQFGLSQADIDLLQSIANQVAVALQNANQYAETQKALRETEIFRRFTLDAGQGMALGRPDGSSFYINPAMAQLIGLDYPVDLAAFNFQQYFAAWSTEKLIGEVLPAVMQTGQWQGELEMVDRYGRSHPVLQNMFAIRDEAGELLFTAGVVTDLTERKRAEALQAAQARELSKVAQISTALAALLDQETLLTQAANSVREQFDLYHAQVYLLDQDGQGLNLAAGAGQVGRQLAVQGWRIPLDLEHSLVARCARLQQPVISNDVRSEPGFLPNPLLPRTAAEMAVPLVVGDLLLGVLDVQSDQPGRFGELDASIQGTLAAQLAVALQNAGQYQQLRRSEELTRTIINATPDWILIKDLKHRYQLVNTSFAQAFGLQPEQLLGKDDLEIGFPEEVVLGSPEKGIVGFWADDDAVIASQQMKVVPSEPGMSNGKPVFLSTIKLPVFDQAGQVSGVLAFVRDITDREMLRQQTEERLAEIDSLYRAMSREAWKTFQQRRSNELAFFYDQTQVAPAQAVWEAETRQAIEQNAIVQSAGEASVVAAPLALRGDVIGALAVQVDAAHPLTPDELALLQDMSDQVALAMESARLFEQTQLALSETETLYGIIAEMNAAESYADILSALASRTLLGQAGPMLLLSLFDRPLSPSHRPEWIFPVAHRTNRRIEIAPRYPLSAFEATPGALFTDQPAVLRDLASDHRLDRVARTLFQEVFQAERSLLVPLVLGGQAIGFIQGFFDQPVEFPESELQRMQAVAGQAAIAVQSRLLLEQAQARARQEQRIREVTAQVFNAADVDSIMRRAVEQVGHALGLPAYIYLGQPERAAAAAQPEPAPGALPTPARE